MNTLCFDLDGTLTDPKQGIIRSIQYAMKAFAGAAEICETPQDLLALC